MTEMDLLLWARGPGFDLAIALFLFGLLARLTQIFVLGRKPDLAPARAAPAGPGWRTVWRRFFAQPGMVQRSPVTHIAGHLFHFGLFIVIFFFIPHIELFKALFGLVWPGLPTPAIDAVAVLSMAALLSLLYTRVTDPVRRQLSDIGDYLAWSVTFLPLLTGYLAYHRLLLPYTTLLTLHILSAELLLICIPLTRLTHLVTLVPARWFNGAIAGRKGVEL